MSRGMGRCGKGRMSASKDCWQGSRQRVADGVRQMRLIASSRQCDVRRDLDIVTVPAQQSNEGCIDAVVVDVNPHRPNLARSSVVRARGFPEYLMAGSFIPVASASRSSF